MIWLAFKIGRFLSLENFHFLPLWLKNQTLIHVEIVFRYPCTNNLKTCLICYESLLQSSIIRTELEKQQHSLPNSGYHLISYSVSNTEGVFRTIDHPKFEQANKWLFIQIDSKLPYFNRGYEFLQKQLGKPINHQGASLWNMWCCIGKFRPKGAYKHQTLNELMNGQKSWFCSEFVITYLLILGFDTIIKQDPCQYTPAQVYINTLDNIPNTYECLLNPYLFRSKYSLEPYAIELKLTNKLWLAYLDQKTKQKLGFSRHHFSTNYYNDDDIDYYD